MPDSLVFGKRGTVTPMSVSLSEIHGFDLVGKAAQSVLLGYNAGPISPKESRSYVLGPSFSPTLLSLKVITQQSHDL